MAAPGDPVPAIRHETSALCHKTARVSAPWESVKAGGFDLGAQGEDSKTSSVRFIFAFNALTVSNTPKNAPAVA